jgi:hypothetical protein
MKEIESKSATLIYNNNRVVGTQQPWHKKITRQKKEVLM